MGQVICLKCRQPLDQATGQCPRCLSPASGASLPDPLVQERRFLLDRAVELSDLAKPAFMGHQEADLKDRVDRVPPLPPGVPHVAPRDEEGVEKLVKQLSGGDPQQRALAAIQLARHPTPESVFALLRRLGDRDGDVRTATLWALGKAGNPLILPPLLEFEKLEKDRLVRAQLAATLHALITRFPSPQSKSNPDIEQQIAQLEVELASNPTAEGFLKRGRLEMKRHALLRSVGNFTRATLPDGSLLPDALLHRSQAFLLMGKPLFSMDDLIDCPQLHEYPPVFFIHRVALTALARQIVAAAREKGLNDYASLFEGRLERLSKKESPA